MTIAKLNSLETGVEVCQKINEIIDDKADVNADTTGNAGTATKLKTARTITLTGDVTGSASFDGSENKSITTTLGNTTKIDGQWVSSTKTLSTATAIGSYTIDLSTYLPNDNYNYEVIVCFYGLRNSGDNNSFVSIGVVNDLPASSSEISSTKAFAFTSFDGNHRETGDFDTILFINSNRKAYFKIANTAIAASYLNACAYRRIGENT